MKKLILLVAILVRQFQLGGALIGSLVGGRILVRLHDNFEQNNKIIFTYRSIFDKSDGMTDISGIRFRLLDYPKGPGLDLSDKFGVLQVLASTGATQLFPNNFTVIFIDGDMIEGEMEVEYVLPSGARPSFITF
jgi:hypothetical protein